MEHARTLDHFLPEYRHNEVHETVISAPLESVRRAVREVKGREIPLARLLFGIRLLPGRLLGRRMPERDYEKTILDSALASGFVLLSDSPDEIVLGVVGQFWKLTGEIVRLSGPEEFLAFSQEGYAKGAVDFILEEQADGRVRLRTETRVLPLGLKASRRFGLYWKVVQPGSALLRRAWLSAIRRRAESAAPPAR